MMHVPHRTTASIKHVVGLSLQYFFNTNSAFLHQLLLLLSVLFGTLRIVLQEQPEGGEAKQEGLDKPQAASGRVVDPFVTAGKKYKSTLLLTTIKPQFLKISSKNININIAIKIFTYVKCEEIWS